jgi:hypothetical protein
LVDGRGVAAVGAGETDDRCDGFGAGDRRGDLSLFRLGAGDAADGAR